MDVHPRGVTCQLMKVAIGRGGCCGKKLDSKGLHAVTCKCGAGITMMHGTCADIVAKAAKRFAI